MLSDHLITSQLIKENVSQLLPTRRPVRDISPGIIQSVGGYKFEHVRGRVGCRKTFPNLARAFQRARLGELA